MGFKKGVQCHPSFFSKSLKPYLSFSVTIHINQNKNLMDTTKLKIEGLTVLTAEDVYNMLVGAIEGGSNYWYQIDTEINKFVPEMKGEPYVDKLITVIQKGHPVKVVDVESEDFLGTLLPDSWAKAEKLMIEKHRSHLGDILAGNDDATTADVFFQLAVIGELTYG